MEITTGFGLRHRIKKQISSQNVCISFHVRHKSEIFKEKRVNTVRKASSENRVHDWWVKKKKKNYKFSICVCLVWRMRERRKKNCVFGFRLHVCVGNCSHVINLGEMRFDLVMFRVRFISNYKRKSKIELKNFLDRMSP